MPIGHVCLRRSATRHRKPGSCARHRTPRIMLCVVRHANCSPRHASSFVLISNITRWYLMKKILFINLRVYFFGRITRFCANLFLQGEKILDTCNSCLSYVVVTRKCEAVCTWAHVSGLPSKNSWHFASETRAKEAYKLKCSFTQLEFNCSLAQNGG